MPAGIITKQSNIDNEALSILGQDRHFIMPTIKLTLHTKDDNIEIDLVSNIRISRNYNTNLTDVIHLEFLITAGTFNKRIYPNRDNIEVSISFNYADEALRILTYKFLLTTKKLTPHNSHDNKLDEADEDTQDLFTVRGQCVDKLTLNLKNKYISGIYHNHDLEYFIRSLFNYELSKLGVTYKVNIYSIDNKKVYKNILIKPFTKLIKIPYTLHNDMFGVYNTGINVYFTKIRYGGEYKTYSAPANKDKAEFLFGTGENYDVDIFPLADHTRYDKETKRTKLLLVSPSVKDMGTNENDFYYKDGVYKLVVSDVKFSDDTDKKRYNTGTTLAIVDGDMLKDTNTYNITNDKILYPDATTNSLESVDDKPATYDSIVDLDKDYNLYRYRTTISQHEHILGLVKFGNINPDFIYPGMPFKYIFEKDDKVIETTGIVQSVEYYYDIANKTIVTALACMFKRIKEK